MISNEKAAAILKDFGQLISLGILEFDEDQNCRLVYNDNVYLSISFDPEHDAIVLSTYVAPFPERNANSVLKALLEANYFWLGTNGATLSIDSESSRIAMMTQIKVENLDVSEFHLFIQAFVDSTEAWSEMIRSLEAGEDSNSENGISAKGEISQNPEMDFRGRV